MEKPFRFRRAREIAGAFVLLSLALLFTGIVMHGQIRGWFEQKEEFDVLLPEDGTQGLKAGSDVMVLGNKAGTVRRVELRDKKTNEPIHDYSDVDPQDIAMYAILEVRGDMSVFVGTDSKATLRRDLAGFGSSYFEISRGEDHDWGDKNRVLDFAEPEDVKDQLTATIETIESKIVPALEAFTEAFETLTDDEQAFQQALVGINETVTLIKDGDNALGLLLADQPTKETVKKLIADIGKTGESLSASADKLDTLMKGMSEGQGVLGALLKDTQPAGDFATLMANLKTGSESLNQSLESIKGGANQFPTVIGKADDTVEEINEAVKILQQALADIQLVAEGLQGHWLIQGSVDDVKEERAKAEEAQRQAAEQAAQPEGAEKKKRGWMFWKR